MIKARKPTRSNTVFGSQTILFRVAAIIMTIAQIIVEITHARFWCGASPNMKPAAAPRAWLVILGDLLLHLFNID